jgi:hypothetical protein
VLRLLEAARPSPGDAFATNTLPSSERIRTTLNFYDYAGQDPINNYDLDGLSFGHWLHKHVVKPAEDHAGAISAIASGAALIPGVDVIAAPAAVGFGALAAYKDRHHPVALALDIAGAASGAGALAIAGKAGDLEKAASAAWRNETVAGWLRTDASTLHHRALVVSFGSFGLSAFALHPHP